MQCVIRTLEAEAQLGPCYASGSRMLDWYVKTHTGTALRQPRVKRTKGGIMRGVLLAILWDLSVKRTIIA